MGRLHTWRRRALARFLERDLKGKITYTLLAGALAFGLLVTVSSYLWYRNLLVQHALALLEAHVKLEQRDLELRVDGLMRFADSLATNTVTANALADSLGREAYLAPLLSNQKLGVAGAEIRVVDYLGRVVAGSAPEGGSPTRDDTFRRMIETEKPRAGIEQPGTSAALLVVALPIRYRLTNNVEGGVIVRIPMAGLLNDGGQDLLRIVDRQGVMLAGLAAPRSAIEQSRALQLPEPLDALGLALVLARDSDKVLAALNLLLVIFLAIGVLISLGVVTFAHAATRFIARPLGEIAGAAEEIAASGRPVAELPVRSGDEFGRLSSAFNTMVERLRASYEELEQRVLERTLELEYNRRAAEEARRLLEEAVQSIAVGFSIFDADDQLVMCNDAYRRFHAIDPAPIVAGATFESIVRAGAEAGRYPDAAGRVDAWVAAQLRQHRAAHGQAVELRLADERWLLTIEQRTPSGYIVGNWIDITERRAAESRLQDRTDQLNAIFSLSPDGFVSFDRQRRVKYVSPAFRRMTNLPDDAVLEGMDETSFSQQLAAQCSDELPFPGLSALRSAPASAQGVPPGQPQAARHLVEISKAGRRVLEVGMRLAETETVSQILYLRDVTHETEVDRMKSEFLSTAAHELRTPMASIYGFSELLLSGRLPEARRRESMEAIHRQSRLMIAIVNELLDLARIDARRGKDFNLERIDVRALLQEAIANFQPPARRELPRLDAAFPDVAVAADRIKLLQAVSNVLSNAYKYSPGGGEVRVAMVMQADDSGRKMVGLEIQDHGIGLRPQERARVSERFFRADTSGKIPGTGLGMSIVKEIIELHGGRMEIESEYGEGTTVTLWLPAG